jgi:DNA ligase (NAD+)
MDEFLGSTEEELLKVPEVGPKVAKAILDWIRNPKNKKEVNELLISGVKIITVSKKQDGPFNGKSFLITGTLPVKRDEAQDWIEKNGGKILSSVSSKLDFLVVGDDPGSKLIKAQSLGLKIISWDELKKMI